MNAMHDLLALLHRIAPAWAGWMMSATWQGLVTLGLVLLVLASWRRATPAGRYLLLLIALAKFALPPFGPTGPGLFRWVPCPFISAPASAVAVRPASNPVPVPSPAPAVAPTGDHRSAIPADLSGVRQTPPPSTPDRALASLAQPGLAGWLLLAQVAGTLALAAGLAAQAWALRRRIRRARRVREGELFNELASLATQMGLRRAPVLYLSESFQAPQAGGPFRPFIILPAWASNTSGENPSTSAEVRRILLAHELAHHRRRDPLTGWLQILVQVWLWWNPAVWWLNRRIRTERELCCDDLVLGLGLARGANYSRLLVDVAGRLTRREAALELVGMADPFRPLKTRVLRALNEGLQRPLRLSLASAALLLAIAVLVLPGAPRAQEAKAEDNASSDSVRITKQDPSGAWRVTTKTGVVLELLGVAPYPAQEKPWWSPGGTPLTEPIYDTANVGTGPTTNETAYTVALKIVSVPPGASIPDVDFTQSNGGGIGSPRKGGQPVANTLALVYNLPKDQTKLTVRLGFATAPWEKRATIPMIKNISCIVQAQSLGSLACGAPYEQDGRAHLTISLSNNGLGHLNYQLVAIDADGREHPDTGSSVGSNDVLQCTFTFDLPLDRIKEFHFQTRPYEWTEIKDVALRPESKNNSVSPTINVTSPTLPIQAPMTSTTTTTTMKPSSIPAPSSEPPAMPGRLTLKNGVTLELVGVSPYPSSAHSWWGMDGKPLAQAPYDTTNEKAGILKPNQAAYEVALRWVNRPPDASILYWDMHESQGGGSGNGFINGRIVEDLAPALYTLPKDKEHLTVRVGCATGPWEVRAEFDPSMKGIKSAHWNGGDLIYSEPYEKNGRTVATIVFTRATVQNQDFRLIAIDQDGHEQLGDDTGYGENEISQHHYSFNLPLAQIKSFQFRTRPLEWAEFKDVPLRPGMK